MDCLDYQDLLSEYIDGDLKPNKRLMVSDHLKCCQNCSQVYQDLKQIVGLSQQLPLLAPDNALWKKIEKDLSEISMAPQPNSKSTWAKFWQHRWQFTISAPQLTTAFATLIVLTIFASTFSYAPQNSINYPLQNTIIAQPVKTYVASPAEIELIGTIERLSHSIKERYQEWDPEIQKLYNRNLILVNQTIEDCNELSKRKPNDPLVHELMVTAYQEKIRLLEQFLSYNQ
ncbi:MAG: zf-HC2 domain-containing protein [Acidobacteria bacterium]|nr:zf-HC2 domain-containing protein [Acidobacteriota bacterium]